MNIKDFIGKEVVNNESGEKYILTKIDGVEISVRPRIPNQYGSFATYSWRTGTAPNDNAIAKGTLVFLDQTLKEQFCEAYERYCYLDGKDDQYLYYSKMYD